MKLGLRSGLKSQLRHFLARRGYALQKINDLTQLADLLGSDKGTRFSAHLYTRIYDRFFSSRRKDSICLLEIGLMRPDLDARRVINAIEGKSSAAASLAPSLAMWRTYFPKAELYGFDIDDFSSVKISNCKILRGDSGSCEDLDQLARDIGRPIDILIEDASHASHHQQICLGALFPHVASGGMFVIEDLHWQDETLERKGAPKTRELLRQLQVQGVFPSPYLSPEEQSYIEKNTAKVWLYDSLTSDVEDGSDALAILVKR